MAARQVARRAWAQLSGYAASSAAGPSPAAAGATWRNPVLMRALSAEAAKPTPSSGGGSSNAIRWMLLGGLGAGAAFSYTLFTSKMPQPGSLPTAAAPAAHDTKDYGAVKQAVADLMDVDGYDDGSYGPVLVRLAWHASGTYDAKTNTGGSNGATMRFPPESQHGANNGLDVARKVLEPVKARFPWISYADLWTLAGAVAIEEMGGPSIPWRPGRSDSVDGSTAPPDGRLPDASQGAAHIRAVFGRMGFTDQEAVALIGAHALGRCHTTRSGYDGPWTNAPTTFSNLYFKELVERSWVKRKWSGPVQYEDKQSRALMMLPTDMVLLTDKAFKKWTTLYANDEDAFFKDFATAFSKLLELGVPFPEGTKAV